MRQQRPNQPYPDGGCPSTNFSSNSGGPVGNTRTGSLPTYEETSRSRQRIEQCPGLLEVKGVEPFGEPAVDLGQELTGFGALVLLLPQPTQAQRRPQLPRLGLLA